MLRVADLRFRDGAKKYFTSFELLAIIMVAYFGAQKIFEAKVVSFLVLAS